MKTRQFMLGNTLYRWSRSYGVQFRGENGWIESAHTLKTLLNEPNLRELKGE